MKAPMFFSAVLALSLTACAEQDSLPASDPAEPAVAVLKSGEQVYKDVCRACHASGVAKAPKTGDQDDWEKLREEGQAVVTAHGWVGVRGMPPKGGRPNLSLEEFARATAWMARSAGADWQDPDDDMLEEIREEEEKRIEDLKSRS
jgi:cytochrome c5